MNARQIKKDVYWVGAVDWERKLFDEFVPLPHGTSYNAYFVRGSEKCALLDTVDPRAVDVLLSRLGQLGVTKIDYLVSHHAEQDHSGAIPEVLKMFPDATVICSAKGKPLLMSHIGLPDSKIRIVQDGESLSLGDKSLQFIYFPWVHWPETMLTWLSESKTLFTCDLFGSHMASSDVFAGQEPTVLTEAKRYYAEIMMPFHVAIGKSLDNVARLGAEMIAPSHGPVYDDPTAILNSYREWVSGPPKNLAVIPYISMHESTRRMVFHLVDALSALGVSVAPFNLTESDIGSLAMAMVDASTLIVASPIVLGGIHPNAANALFLINAIRPKVRHLAVISSYGWAGKIAEQVKEMLPNLKVDMIEPVTVQGIPVDTTFKALDQMAMTIREKHLTVITPLDGSPPGQSL